MKVTELFEDKDLWKQEILKVIAEDSTDLARSLKPPFGTIPVPCSVSQAKRLISRFKKAGLKIEEENQVYLIGQDKKFAIDFSDDNKKGKALLYWK